ncbi:outer membrane beta-barrel protein [Helicobacter bilis]|uniref:Outer membrane beta-barrel protein n=2 Tax=Helicobacter bilis TaxID=37372 RepID=A0A6D2C780_9HELI|nr:outer membrane beta-barrel protein [Helicobacter bilis]EMZ38385.1 hypothetical protein C826_01421 [Helicobacter bilis WiWa]TLE03894.1 outer membrane beta-barrel protein [Helicobacter bilis]TLE04849.1 outer membrane beta-barrel protein [Helicobacter bilis]
MRKIVSISAVLCSIMFANNPMSMQQDYMDNPYDNMPQNSTHNQDMRNNNGWGGLSPEKESYNAKKRGWFIGFNIPFASIHSRLYVGNLFSVATLDIKGNIVGFGLKGGYQTFQDKIPSLYLWGNRFYMSYDYMGATLNGESNPTATKSDKSIYVQNILFHVDAIIDIPFNFKKPNSGLSVSFGVLLGGHSHYTGISKMSFSPALGFEAGVGVNIAAKHRIEYTWQILIPYGKEEIGNYAKPLVSNSIYSTADSLKNSMFSGMSYSYVF